MRVIRPVDLDGKVVNVKELTVGEVRKWLAELQMAGKSPESVDVVGSLLFEDADIGDIARMTDLPADGMDDLMPSEIEKILTVCKQVNSHFFGMRQRLYDRGKAAMESMNLKSLSEPAASSSGTDTQDSLATHGVST